MKGKRVRVTKLREAANPVERAGLWGRYVPVSANDSSLPVDYEMVGTVVTAPVPGDYFRLDRTHRNGEEVPGLFQSTEVQEVSEWGFTTGNWVYRVDLL